MSNQTSSTPSEFDQKVYIDLDSLLDTRVGVVAIHSPEAATMLMQEGYWTRESDDYSELTQGLVTHSQFKQWWKERDKQALIAARPTNFIRILEELSEALVVSQVNLPFVSRAQYLVNYWPYQLEELEVAAIQQACEILTGNVVEVKMVFMKPEQLTPQWIKREVSLLVMYDYWSWMEAQKDNFRTHAIPEVNLLAPAVSHDRVITKEDRTVEHFGEVNPFAVSEMVMSVYVSLQLLPPAFFSLLRA